MPHLYQDEISLNHIKKDFEKYSWGFFCADLRAGLAVAMLTVPQALAYALVAGLPVYCGLFASIYIALIVALFGSSRHLVVGPSNAIAILIQACLIEVFTNYYRGASPDTAPVLVVHVLSQLMLLVGGLQMLAGFFKLGRLTHFVSHSVIVGYLFGVALALVINQLFPLMGLDVPTNVPSLYGRFTYILSHIRDLHLPTTWIGLSCLAMLWMLRRYSRQMPVGAIVLGLVAVIALAVRHFFYSLEGSSLPIEWVEQVRSWVDPIALVGDAKAEGILPDFSLPYFDPGLTNRLLPVSFAIGLLSIMEAISASKALAAESGQRLSTNQEIFGLGLGNFLAAFMGAMPVSGSPSRSMISFENGAKTRLAAVFNSVFVALILFVFGFLIQYIPIAAFAALLIFSASNIINVKQLFLCWKATPSDAFVLVLTMLSCIFLSLDVAFYIGVVLSISLYLKKAAVPQLVEFQIDATGALAPVERFRKPIASPIRCIKVEGELFFGAADLFQSALKSMTEGDESTKVVILQLKNARDIDATSCLALEQLHRYLKNSGRHLIACGLTYHIWEVLSDSGLIPVLGKENLFIFEEKNPQISTQRAFARAKEWLAAKQVPMPSPPLVEELLPLSKTSQTFSHPILEQGPT